MRNVILVGVAAASMVVSVAVGQPLDPSAGWAPMVVQYERIGTGAFTRGPVLVDSNQLDPANGWTPLRRDPNKIGTGAFAREPVMVDDPQQLDPNNGWRPMRKTSRAIPMTR